MKSILLLIAYVLLAFAGISQVNRNMVAHYPLNGNAIDISQNRNHGIIVGGVRPTSNRFGLDSAAMEFFGNGYIKVPHNKNLQQISDSLTITTWAKISVTNQWFTICCKGDKPYEDIGSPHFRLQLTPTTAALNSEVIGKFKPRFKPGIWYFLAVCYNGNRLKMHINGQQIVDTIIAYKMQANNDDLLIGRDIPGNDEFFIGELDDLRIYNRALSTSDILTIMNDDSDKPKPPKKDNIVVMDTVRRTIAIRDTVRQNVYVSDTIRRVVEKIDTLQKPVVVFDTIRVAVKDTVRKTVALSDTINRSFVKLDTVRIVVNDTIRNVVERIDSVSRPVFIQDTLFRTVEFVDSVRKPLVLYDTIRITVNDTLWRNDPPLTSVDGSNNKRSVEYQHTIMVKSRCIKLLVFDSQNIDNDTVSLYFNGNVIVENYRLIGKSSLSLAKNGFTLCLSSGENILVSKAINLGKVPPNTLTIELYEEKRQPVRFDINSDMTINGAVKIVFDERPFTRN